MSNARSFRFVTIKNIRKILCVGGKENFLSRSFWRIHLKYNVNTTNDILGNGEDVCRHCFEQLGTIGKQCPISNKNLHTHAPCHFGFVGYSFLNGSSKSRLSSLQDRSQSAP